MRTGIRVLMGMCLFLIYGEIATWGQIVVQYEGLSRYELGAQFSGLQLNGAVTGGSPGLGLHFGYNYNQFFSVDADLNGYEIASGNVDTAVGLFGPRIGYRSQEFGIYAKVRPGFVHLPSNEELIPPVAKHPTRFAVDTGFVMVRYFENHTYVRFDLGRMFVNYGGGSYTDPMTGRVTHLGTPGGVLIAVGVGAHW